MKQKDTEIAEMKKKNNLIKEKLEEGKNKSEDRNEELREMKENHYDYESSIHSDDFEKQPCRFYINGHCKKRALI